jgi:hypothetical protein
LVQYGVPTVLEARGIRVVVDTSDHAPAHVHCRAGGRWVIVALVPEVAVRGRTAMPEGTLRRVLDLVRANRGFLTLAFREVHP